MFTIPSFWIQYSLPQGSLLVVNIAVFVYMKMYEFFSVFVSFNLMYYSE